MMRKGWGHAVLDASIKAGAHGGTILFGRGVGIHEQQTILSIPIEPEKEIVLTLTYAGQVDVILAEIVRSAELNEPAHGLAFVVPVDKVVGIPHVNASD